MENPFTNDPKWSRHIHIMDRAVWHDLLSRAGIDQLHHPDLWAAKGLDRTTQLSQFLDDDLLLKLVDLLSHGTTGGLQPNEPCADSFFSYNWNDTQEVDSIFLDLAKEGVFNWRDTKRLPRDQQWWQEIERQIKRIPKFVLFMGAHGLGNTQERELNVAAQIRKPIILVRIKTFASSVWDSSLSETNRRILASYFPIDMGNADSLEKLNLEIRL